MRQSHNLTGAIKSHSLIQRTVSASHRGQRYVPALRPLFASATPSATRSIITRQLGQVTWPTGNVWLLIDCSGMVRIPNIWMVDKTRMDDHLRERQNQTGD